MNKNNYFNFWLILFCRTLLLCLFCFVVTCGDAEDYEDVEVTIVSTVTKTTTAPDEYEPTKMAIIQYTVENIGNKTINGWEVFFNVNLTNGPQVLATDNVYYNLEPGKISSVRLAKASVPLYYGESSSASFNYIETW